MPSAPIYPAAVARSVERLTIAQVTPYPWGVHHEVNAFVERAAVELPSRGPPGRGRRPRRHAGRAARARSAAIEQRASGPTRSSARRWDGDRAGGRRRPGPPGRRGAPAAGRAAARGRRRCRSTSRGRSRRCSAASSSTSSTSTTRSRRAPPRWRCATRGRSTSARFHLPTERVLSTQVARPLVEIFFGRLDARTASCAGAPRSCWAASSRAPTRSAGAAAEGARPERARRDAAGRPDRLLRPGGARGAAALPAGAAAGCPLDLRLGGRRSGSRTRGDAAAEPPAPRAGPDPAPADGRAGRSGRGADAVCAASGGPRSRRPA